MIQISINDYSVTIKEAVSRDSIYICEISDGTGLIHITLDSLSEFIEMIKAAEFLHRNTHIELQPIEIKLRSENENI